MKIIKPAIFTVSLLSIPFVTTAETYSLDVNVIARVPTSTGLVISPVGDWASRTQTMNWDMAGGKLNPISQQLDIKSGLGGVNAYLVQDAVLTSAANAIPLTVAINGKNLQTGAAKSVEILTPAQALASQRVSYTIKPDEGTHASGDYSGLILTMFESDAAP